MQGKPTGEPSLAIPSLNFPDDRRVLRVGEFAKQVSVSDQHVINLLEEGRLIGFDIAGRFEYLRVPAAAIDALAARCHLSHEDILQVINSTQPRRSTGRAFWRIPIKEGFEAFLKETQLGDAMTTLAVTSPVPWVTASVPQ